MSWPAGTRVICRAKGLLESVPRVLFLFRSDEASGSGATVVGRWFAPQSSPEEGTREHLGWSGDVGGGDGQEPFRGCPGQGSARQGEPGYDWVVGSMSGGSELWGGPSLSGTCP